MTKELSRLLVLLLAIQQLNRSAQHAQAPIAELDRLPEVGQGRGLVINGPAATVDLA